MEKLPTQNNIPKQLGSGLTAVALTGTLAMSFAAVTNLSLLVVLACCIICALFSLKKQNKIFAPHPYFIVPLIYVLSSGSSAAALIAVSLGGVVALLAGRLENKITIPTPIVAGGAIGLSLACTVLLTNVYFGIGAFGTTPFEMLKNYRYLGFHPNFMGLLTGTITLFTMITYPFKFKKLSKIIPAPFITVLIPCVLNLFLNPVKKYTTINETFFTEVKDFDFSSAFSSLSVQQIPIVLKTSLVFGLLFLFFSLLKKEDDTTVNSSVNIFSCLPVTSYDVPAYGKFSALTMIAISVVLILFAPGIFQRISLHSLGAMLIVSAWQSLPAKHISQCFRKRDVISIIVFFFCVVSFILFDIFAATVICLLISTILSPKRKEAHHE